MSKSISHIAASGLILASSTMGMTQQDTASYTTMVPEIPVTTFSLSDVSSDSNHGSMGAYSRRVSELTTISRDQLEKAKRYACLKRSFDLNLHGFPEKMRPRADELMNALAPLPFHHQVANYDEYDESIDFRLSLPYELKLSVSHFLDEEDDSVVFSIHRNHELLVSNEMSIAQLTNSLKEVIDQLEHHV